MEKKEEVLFDSTTTIGIICFRNEMELDLSKEHLKYPTKFTKEIPKDNINTRFTIDDYLYVTIIGNTVIQQQYYENAQELSRILGLQLKIFVSEKPYDPVCFCFGDNRRFGFVVAPIDSEDIRAKISEITKPFC